MDIRTLLVGVLSVVAVLSGTVLYALDKNGGEALIALAGAALTYLVGLYSEPYDGEA